MFCEYDSSNIPLEKQVQVQKFMTTKCTEDTCKLMTYVVMKY